MVKETRHIIFSRSELIAALNSYRRDNKDLLPAGKIVSCELKTDTPAAVGVATPQAPKMQTVNLDPARLLEPLIRYCIVDNHIVLPLQGRKSVSIGDDHAALTIQLTTIETNNG